MNTIPYLMERTYPGRGIILGITPDQKHAAAAYFIMGRSDNSRNRVFEKTEDGIRTFPYDVSRVKDPSLILYHPVRRWGNTLIVTNGDQTDTIAAFLKEGKSFEEALLTRTYEPDAPHYTTRISGLITMENGAPAFKLSLLRKAAGSDECRRDTYEYIDLKGGETKIIHTYAADVEPLPPFEGEPKTLEIAQNDIEAFANSVWNSLHSDNRISLYACFLPVEGGEAAQKIINRFS
ncbi:IMP cyclohydrolase [Christensenellaceae bacterium OttesenSCG-928-M15]|nr:IMP cyclohydrolase [Christensenellaceae bacterium OttesenSCG-928-M15]